MGGGARPVASKGRWAEVCCCQTPFSVTTSTTNKALNKSLIILGPPSYPMKEADNFCPALSTPAGLFGGSRL